MAPPPTPVRPQDLVLRCYARRSGRLPGRWVVHCVDLDLWAVGSNFPEARKSLEDAILGYLESVLDTDDSASIPELLKRRASLRYLLLWHLIKVVHDIAHNGRRPLDSQPFEQHLPFHLAVA